MKIVFFGTPTFAVPTLAALVAHPEIQVQGVVTQPDRRRGRGSKLMASPVKQWAQEQDLRVWQPERLRKCETTQGELEDCGADFFVVVAYGQLLPPRVLALPAQGCINVHGSLLPQYRGAAPIQWAIANGDSQTGITTMLMDEGMDTGAMLLKQTTPINPWDTASTLGDRLATLGAELLIQTLEGLDQQTLTPIPQDSAIATYAPLLQKSDFVLDWTQPAQTLHGRIRGFYPACFIPWGDQTLKILNALPIPYPLNPHALETFLAPFPAPVPSLLPALLKTDISPGNPGDVVGIVKSWGPLIQTGDGLLLLETVQPPGKRPQSGGDFVNGHSLTPGPLASHSPRPV